MTQARDRLNSAALSALLFLCVFFALHLFLNNSLALGCIFVGCALFFIRSLTHSVVPATKELSLTSACAALWLSITYTLLLHGFKDQSTILYWLFPLLTATVILLGVKRGSIIALGALSISLAFITNTTIYYQALAFILFLILIAVLLCYVEHLEKTLEKAQKTDPLTGCTSITHFKHKIESATGLYRRYKSQVSCLSLSIENTRLKYHEKERYLLEIAQVCQSRIRQTDVICHYSPSLFLILLPNTDLDSAHKLGEDLLQACEAYKFSYAANKHEVTPRLTYKLTAYSEKESWESWLNHITS